MIVIDEELAGRGSVSYERSRRADRRGVGRRPRAQRLPRQRRAGAFADRRRPLRLLGDVHDAVARPHPHPGRRRRGPGPLRARVAADDHDQQGDRASRSFIRRSPGARGSWGSRRACSTRSRTGCSIRAATSSCSCASGSTRGRRMRPRSGRRRGSRCARAIGVAVEGRDPEAARSLVERRDVVTSPFYGGS